MAAPVVVLAKLDSILRDMAKQNAALLELVAYGESVYPAKPTDFQQEHRYFVNNVTKALEGAPFFAISAIEHGRELPVFATFHGATDRQQTADVELSQPAPDSDLFSWLQHQCTPSPSGGPLSKAIQAWRRDQGQTENAEINILPYLVSRKWGENLKRVGGVTGALQEIRSNREILNEFLHTKPVPFFRDEPPRAIANAYFRAYVCLGVRRQWREAFEYGYGKDAERAEKKGDFDALVETLMVFYQMSWGNLSIIEDLDKRQQRARTQQAALTYTLIREPIEALVKHLQEAQRPLGRLHAVLSPVRGLFASNIVDEKFFTGPRQMFEIRTGQHQVEIGHEYDHFDNPETRDALAAEQIAAVLLAVFGELKEAKAPLWEYLRYALNFNDTYRRVADILLDRFPELFSRGSSNLKGQKEVEELFYVTKYWFYRAGRHEEPMRVDYLNAGLDLLLPKGAASARAKPELNNEAEFWISSEMPVHTLSGLEELCREYGGLASVDLGLKRGEAGQTATLALTFAGESAKRVAETKLKPIKKGCRAYKEETSVTRGNMVFAIMQIFGDEPQCDGWEEKDEGERDEREKVDGKRDEVRVFWLEKHSGRVTLTFGKFEDEKATITLEWAGPVPD